MDSKLLQMYDDIKAKSAEPVAVPVQSVKISPLGMDKSPGAMVWRNKALGCADHLKEKCRKHLLLDIYCKIIPLDKEFVDDNMGMMKGDIDSMLAAKGMDATQYLKSACESTEAPFVEYLMWATDTIGRTYMEEKDEELKAAQDDGQIEDPEELDLEDDKVDSALIDVKKDMEYETFVDELKKKTVDKIVADISKIIDDEKKDDGMEFQTESAVQLSMNYINKKIYDKEITEAKNEEIIGMAIREATLHELDLVFNQPLTSREYETTIRSGKGYVVNESSVNTFIESLQQ